MEKDAHVEVGQQIVRDLEVPLRVDDKCRTFEPVPQRFFVFWPRLEKSLPSSILLEVGQDYDVHIERYFAMPPCACSRPHSPGTEKENSTKQWNFVLRRR